jgi:hypothetical protein
MFSKQAGSILALALLIGFAALRPAHAQTKFEFGERYALIISGVGGQDAFKEKYFEQGKQLYDLLVFELSYSTMNVLFLAEDPTVDPERISGISSATTIRNVFGDLGERLKREDQLLIFLVGHGTYDGMWAKFNLVGPDLRDIDYAELLAALPIQKIVFVNTSSASGPFVDRLSGAERVIITATKSGYEHHATTFADFFLDAFANTTSDIDKDGKISMLEAFEFVSTAQERRYEDARQLRAEHPLLDDNGDGQGSEKTKGNKDGNWARRVYLGPVSVDIEETLYKVRSGTQTRSDELTLEKAGLEVKIEDLKARKEQMAAAEYSAQLEQLLIRLARVNQELKQPKQK